MKKIILTLLLILLTASAGYSQQSLRIGQFSLKDTLSGKVILRNIGGTRTDLFLRYLHASDSLYAPWFTTDQINLTSDIVYPGGQSITYSGGSLNFNNFSEIDFNSFNFNIGATEITSLLDLTLTGAKATLPELEYGTAYSTSDSIIISGGAGNIDWSAGSIFRGTIVASTTLSIINPVEGQSVTVRLTSSGSHILAFDTDLGVGYIKWPGGVAPTLTDSGVDVFSFIYIAPFIYGSAIQDFQ